RAPVTFDLFVPAINHITADSQTIAHGRALFFDTRLSADGTLACASCHDPARAFTDGRVRARGVRGAIGPRNTPTLLNRGYGKAFSWDGRATSLAEQVLRPIENPLELANTITTATQRLRIDREALANALTAYVASLFSAETSFDRYLAGDTLALSTESRHGRRLFLGKAGCARCHIGPTLTDEAFHNTGVAWRSGAPADSGRYGVTQRSADTGSFKTPTLRAIMHTSPYMHDGSITTLEDVIDHYDRGGIANPNKDPELQALRLHPSEKAALAAFLRSL
ncbi:MAG: cytochrome c peroxidase, partial [Gemmatimonadota bacterium]